MGFPCVKKNKNNFKIGNSQFQTFARLDWYCWFLVVWNWPYWKPHFEYRWKLFNFHYIFYKIFFIQQHLKIDVSNNESKHLNLNLILKNGAPIDVIFTGFILFMSFLFIHQVYWNWLILILNIGKNWSFFIS